MTLRQNEQRYLDAQTAVYEGILFYATESAKQWREAWCMGEGAWRMCTSLCADTTGPWLHFKDEMLRIGREQKEHQGQLGATAQ